LASAGTRLGRSEKRLGEGTRKSRNWSWTELMSCPAAPVGSLARMSDASSSRSERGSAEVKERWYDE
jgi:hypothetical protein